MASVFNDGRKVMDPDFIWNSILTMLVPIAIFVVRGINQKIEKLTDTLSQTREQYATREELQKMMDLLHRLEDKIDRVLSR